MQGVSDSTLFFFVIQPLLCKVIIPNYLNNLHMLDTRIVLANMFYSAGRDEKNSTDLPDNENTQVSRIGIDG